MPGSAAHRAGRRIRRFRHFDGQTWWLIGMIFLITSSLLGAQLHRGDRPASREGLSWMRCRSSCGQLVTSFLLLLAFPPLEAAGVLQLMDSWRGRASCRAVWSSADGH